MSMTLPNLDDIAWEQLNEEARSLIPAYAPAWTNFNPSDPGITLLELMAHFSELLLYRANRISDEQTVNFLRLLNGPTWQAHKPLDLEKEKQTALLTLATRLRAVTAEDFEKLAKSAGGDHAAAQTASSQRNWIARAKCIPGRNLAHAEVALRKAPAPGHMSVVVVPHHGTVPSEAALRKVKHTLDEAKPITTRVHVVAPIFVKFGVRFTLVPQSHASADWIGAACANRLKDFYDPLRGGLDEKGWPFGRNIHVSELYQLLGQIPGLDYVTRSIDPATKEELPELVVNEAEGDRLLFNDADELEAIEVHDEELVALHFNPGDIAIQRKEGRR
jgi:hypothetical protein